MLIVYQNPFKNVLLLYSFKDICLSEVLHLFWITLERGCVSSILKKSENPEMKTVEKTDQNHLELSETIRAFHVLL